MKTSKLYFCNYVGYGGCLFIIKAKNITEARKFAKEYNKDKKNPDNRINNIEELEIKYGVNELGYFGE